MIHGHDVDGTVQFDTVYRQISRRSCAGALKTCCGQGRVAVDRT